MNGFFKTSAAVLLAVLLESSVFPLYFSSEFKPDLLLIIMIYMALRAEVKYSLPTAYTLGLLKDCMSGLYLGLNAFSFLSIYLVIKALSDRLYVQSSLLFVLTVSIATVSSILVNYLLLAIFSQASGLFPLMLSALLPSLLVNAFVASLISSLPKFSALPVVRR